ncbi:MAG: hypothetical protein OEN52_02810 [Gammaproteobacteria bacterium]|nr:hypothetical protein [Gammaproteobacteria bacterium]
MIKRHTCSEPRRIQTRIRVTPGLTCLALHAARSRGMTETSLGAAA